MGGGSFESAALEVLLEDGGRDQLRPQDDARVGAHDRVLEPDEPARDLDGRAAGGRPHPAAILPAAVNWATSTAVVG